MYHKLSEIAEDRMRDEQRCIGGNGSKESRAAGATCPTIHT